MFILNKSLITNIISIIIASVGYYFCEPHIQNIGFYALSGALTNWIAIYMLFERIPFVYGSGIIPNKFESFKKAIKEMIMEQFFSQDKLQSFLSSDDIKNYIKDSLSTKIDYDTFFNSFVDILMDSKYGSMIDMFLGGRKSLEGLREIFISKLRVKVNNIVDDIDASNMNLSSQASDKIEKLIDERINELTPDMVKDIIQKIIREHLGWLVVWGGIFGGIIGLIASFVL
tara:strand:- start:88 stop:774 length:687 start_codon:yes stop_codon:yes gene_type:complete